MNRNIYTESDPPVTTTEPVVCTKPFDNETSRAGDVDEPCENGEG